MKLEALTVEQCEIVRKWRNAEMECWRTPFMLTKEMQRDFYERCCDRNSPHRYWAIVRTIEDEVKGVVPETGFIGMGGITYIQFENRIGEITLIIDPAQRKDGLGEKAVDLIFDQGFNHLNLQTVFGECYFCNPAKKFWGDIVVKYSDIDHKDENGWYPTNSCLLPNRKYWKGKYYYSYYFSIDKDDFNNRNK